MKHAVKHIHFVGIGGAGMSGIAEILHNLGYAVSGSDQSDSATSRRLASLGIRVQIGHDAAHIAGAVTVSELCAAGVAAVLVPLVVSTTSHQRDNAQWLAGQGAGIHLPQGELSPRRLADLLTGLTRDALRDMATRARALAKPKAAARVADQIEGLVAA